MTRHVLRGAAALLLLVMTIACLSQAAHAQTAPTFTVTPATGQGTVTPVATWNVPGASSCTASGGWSGAKAASGTETLPAITKTTAFNLTCATATGTARVFWTPPTQRTDGSPLTNLAGYRIYHGASAASLSSRFDVTSATALEQIVTGLAPGVRYFSMTSVDANGAESARTSVVNTTVVAGSIALPAANVTVDSLPNPPSGVTVQAVVAGVDVAPVYRILQDGTRGEQVAGFVDVGATCTGRAVFTYRGRQYRRVDPAAVTWWATRPTSAAAAACG